MLETALQAKDDDAALVRLLADIFRPEDLRYGHFDNWSISSAIHKHPELVDALEFLGIRRRVSGWSRGSLTSASDTRILRWLRRVEGRNFGGLRIEVDAAGWYRLVRGTLMPRIDDTAPDLNALLNQLCSMRAQLVDKLARHFDGGTMALVGSVDAAAAAVEAEIEARQRVLNSNPNRGGCTKYPRGSLHRALGAHAQNLASYNVKLTIT